MTTNQISKADIEKLIDSLADKSLTFGCEVITKKWNNGFAPETISGTDHGEFVDFECSLRKGTIRASEIDKILGHPIHLHNVLYRITSEEREQHDGDGRCRCIECVIDEVVFLWGNCSFTRSLQEILSSCEWGRIFNDDPTLTAGSVEVPKNPSHKALLEFLLSLNLTK